MSVLGSLKRLWQRWKLEPALEDISPRYSYRIFWTKQALSWSERKRTKIQKAAEKVVQAEDFEPNAYQRLYQLDPLEEEKYAGESILALYEVLEELNQIERSGGSEK